MSDGARCWSIRRGGRWSREDIIDAARQDREVDRNYDTFVRLLSSLPEHRDEFALMRDGKILGFFEKPGDANRAGVETFVDGIFSIQEVTDEPIDLGFWSHVAPRGALIAS